MSSRTRRAAARANARLSTGPVTPEGKAKSRYNALKSGIYSEALIIPGESAEDLARLTAELYEQYNPANPTERFLVDTLISNEWRIRRLRNVEASLWQSADAFVAAAPALERLQRLLNACERSYHRALKELTGLQASTPTQTSPEPEPEQPETAAQTAPTNTTCDFLGSFRQNQAQTHPASPTPPPAWPPTGQPHSETV